MTESVLELVLTEELAPADEVETLHIICGVCLEEDGLAIAFCGHDCSNEPDVDPWKDYLYCIVCSEIWHSLEAWTDTIKICKRGHVIRRRNDI